MSHNLRRAGLIAASGGAYVAAVIVGYNYYSTVLDADDKQKSEGLQPKSDSELIKSAASSNISYINNPCRSCKFQQIAHAYDEQIDKDEIVMGLKLLRRALIYFHARGSVLEVGAGTGRNIPYFPNSCTSILLTDKSDKMLEKAKDKLQLIPPRGRVRFNTAEVDATDLVATYDDNSFDTIVDTFGLCSFDDPVVVLKELQRICRPNGKILLLEHGRSKQWNSLSTYLDKHAERHAMNWGCVWNRDIDQIVQDAGLQIESRSTWHFGTTYYIVCRPGLTMNQPKKEIVTQKRGSRLLSTVPSPVPIAGEKIHPWTSIWPISLFTMGGHAPQRSPTKPIKTEHNN
mmetsp:Transcript_24803/g.44917  ORF Transcript_24803/g.44917 Transcript_24803/m.44917 type:complete len:344 (-) Transcript_24803:12-1043(-)